MQRIPIPEPEPDPGKVALAASALGDGKLVVLPTETVHGLTVDPAHTHAVARLRKFKGRAGDAPFTYHLADGSWIDQLATPPPPRIRAYLARIWPGPLTIILPRKSGDGSVGLRVPAHDFTRATIEKVGHGVFMTSINEQGAAPLLEPEQIAKVEGIDMFFDAGPSRLGIASTIVRYGNDKLEVLREGLLSERDVLVGCSRLFLFVRTGNTCRSPMAETLANQLLAAKLGEKATELLSRGFCFASAGTGTFPGMPASAGAFAAMGERDLDLSQHRSNTLDPGLVLFAEKILCMSESHRQAVLALAPGAKDKVELLRPDGQDIADPYGAPVDVYRRTAAEIEAALRQRLDEILARPR